MEKIKLGSLCITKVDKQFDTAEGICSIKKGTYVTVCDDDNIDKGYVLVESEGFYTVFDYNLNELILIDNSL